MFPTVAHADWSIAPSKRWIAVARRVDSVYVVDAPSLVCDALSRIEKLLHLGGASPLLLGFDFPIGLPLAYAHAAGIDSFRSVLPELGRGKWSTFYELAEAPSDIRIARPFYPARPGGTSHAHLAAGLGVSSVRDLLRVCERKTAQRGSACPLFWTLGGKQVGRAAISGWRDVLAPTMARFGDAAALWPFDGDLRALLETKEIVFAETYPAEACVHLGMTAPGRGWSKRSQAHRVERSECVIVYARQAGVTLTPQLLDAIVDGFGSGKDGEDRFDAVVGVLSMLGVVLDMRADGAPSSFEIRDIEGWIFGVEADAPTRCDVRPSAP